MSDYTNAACACWEDCKWFNPGINFSFLFEMSSLIKSLWHKLPKITFLQNSSEIKFQGLGFIVVEVWGESPRQRWILVPSGLRHNFPLTRSTVQKLNSEILGLSWVLGWWCWCRGGEFWCQVSERCQRVLRSQCLCRIRDVGTSLTFGLCFKQISHFLARMVLRLQMTND